MYRSKYEKRYYESLDSLIVDLFRMFDNCELYNEADSDVVKESQRLRKLLQDTIVR